MTWRVLNFSLRRAESEKSALFQCPPYHALLFRILRVGERHGATTEAEAYVAVFVGVPGYELSLIHI